MSPEHTAELIAKICAKIAHFDPAIVAFDALQRYDVVHAIALVKNIPAQMLLRIKYAGEESHVNTFEDRLSSSIERGLMSHVEQFAAPERWKVPRPGFIRDMCRLALIEHINPKLCLRCHGRGGWTNRKGLKVTCEQCGGSGEGSYSDRQRAKVLGIHEASWRQSWRERYRAIQSEIDKIESIGLGGVAKRIR